MAELDLEALRRLRVPKLVAEDFPENWHRPSLEALMQVVNQWSAILAALERIPELERRMHGLELERDSAEQGDKNAQAIARQWRERAERVEAAARQAREMLELRQWVGARHVLRAALAAAPAIDANAYHEPLTVAFQEREKVPEQPEGDFEPDGAVLLSSTRYDQLDRLERIVRGLPAGGYLIDLSFLDLVSSVRRMQETLAAAPAEEADRG